MTEVGGIDNILKMIRQHLSSTKTTRFTTKQIHQMTSLCYQSVANNLSRLVKAGYLVRHTYYSRKLKQHVVDYTVNPEVVDILENLFNNES